MLTHREKMPNKLAEHRCRANFALDKKLVAQFKQACEKAGITMSAKVAELMASFLREKGER